MAQTYPPPEHMEVFTEYSSLTPRQRELKQLQALARELGKSPTCFDTNKASKEGKCPSSKTYKRHFGGYNNALRTAGLPINQKKTGFSKETTCADCGKKPKQYFAKRLPNGRGICQRCYRKRTGKSK